MEDLKKRASVILMEKLTTSGEKTLRTGATGFLGSHILMDLLAHTTFHLICVVRARTDADAVTRLRRTLTSRQQSLDGYENRVTVLSDDLGRPGMGLPADTLTWLATCIRSVYHCGAWVNMVVPYRTL